MAREDRPEERHLTRRPPAAAGSSGPAPASAAAARVAPAGSAARPPVPGRPVPAELADVADLIGFFDPAPRAPAGDPRARGRTGEGNGSPDGGARPADATAAAEGAPADDPETADLVARLEAEPWAFDFFQAVRRLERAYTDQPRVGQSASPAEDVVRFVQDPTLAFAASSVMSFRPADAARAARMSVNFLGLLGLNGPLPLFLTEYARRRRGRGDRAFARFLDLFNHRMVSLFYRAWAMHQRAVGYDRPGEDRYATYVGSLFGIGMAAFRNRDSVPDIAKLGFGGRLACQTRNADGLAAIVEEYFGIPTRVEQFVGQWIDLPAENLTRLGESRATGTLGNSAVLGSRAWDCQQRFRIRIGPMGFADYQRLMPDGQSIKRLAGWVRNYVGDELSWEVQLVLRAAEVPQVRVGMVGQLGWSTWLISRPASDDRGDLVVDWLAA